jgi:hypothetical protein
MVQAVAVLPVSMHPRQIPFHPQSWLTNSLPRRRNNSLTHVSRCLADEGAVNLHPNSATMLARHAAVRPLLFRHWSARAATSVDASLPEQTTHCAARYA